MSIFRQTNLFFVHFAFLLLALAVFDSRPFGKELLCIFKSADFEFVQNESCKDTVVTNRKSENSIICNDDDCVLAWRRVREKFDHGLNRNITSHEFCRFLGVVEAKAGFQFPDYMLAICPHLIDPKDRRILRFSNSWAVGELNQLNQPREIEGSSLGKVLEVSLGLNCVKFQVDGRNNVVSIPTEIASKFSNPIVLHLPNDNLSMAFLDHKGAGYLAYFTPDGEEPTWISPVAGFTSQSLTSTGPRLSCTAIFSNDDKIIVVRTDAGGLAISTFITESGQSAFHFATLRE